MSSINNYRVTSITGPSELRPWLTIIRYKALQVSLSWFQTVEGSKRARAKLRQKCQTQRWSWNLFWGSYDGECLDLTHRSQVLRLTEQRAAPTVKAQLPGRGSSEPLGAGLRFLLSCYSLSLSGTYIPLASSAHTFTRPQTLLLF